MVITDSKIAELNIHLIENLTPERYEHSKSTGKTAERLCRRFGLDPDKGYLTGLIHDIAREYSDSEIIRICRIGGEKINRREEDDPVLLHGKAGAVMLKEEFQILDEDILDAVRVHTTGERNMSSLAKVLFVADYIEPLRRHITDDYLKELENYNLDEMVKSVLNSIFIYLKSIGCDAAYSSLDLLKELEI